MTGIGCKPLEVFLTEHAASVYDLSETLLATVKSFGAFTICFVLKFCRLTLYRQQDSGHGARRNSPAESMAMKVDGARASGYTADRRCILRAGSNAARTMRRRVGNSPADRRGEHRSLG